MGVTTHCTVMKYSIILLVALQVLKVTSDEEKQEVDIDLSQMIQMGMAIGKSILGEEAVEKLKKGDISEIIKMGEKVLGEDDVKNFMNSVTEGAFSQQQDAEDTEDPKGEDRIINEEENISSDISSEDKNVNSESEEATSQNNG